MPSTGRPLLILGARDYAPVFADVFDGVCGHSVVGFVENLDRRECDNRILDLPIHWIADIAGLAADHAAICCLATTHRDRFVGDVERLGFTFPSLVHPSAFVSARSLIGQGTSLDVGVIVAGFSRIGNHVRIGRGATIGHHTVIEPFVTIHPGANIAGNCVIETKAIVGIGATVIDGCRIGTGSFVAAGATVTRDVPPRALVAGSPAKIIREGYGPR
jgi:acetyltransferase EpsM